MKRELFTVLILIPAIFILTITGCKKDTPPDPVPECDFEFLIQDTEGLPEHLTVNAAHWVFGNAYNLHGAEVNYHLTEAHGHPDFISDIENTDVKWVLDVETYLLDYANHDLFPDIDARIDTLAEQVRGKEENISFFYVADEPYLNGKEITRTMLETAIAKLKEKIPGIPSYIVFTHNYFLTKELSGPGTQPGSNRGIPSNLDIIAFDWYSDVTDGSSLRNIEEYVKPTVEEIKKINPDIPILLTGEAFNKNIPDERLPEAIFRYWDLAAGEPQIIGVDHFLWANNPGFNGLTSLPKAQSIVKALAKEVRKVTGRLPTDNKIPVYEWYHKSEYEGVKYEYRYDSWFWRNWTKSCYLIKEVKFYIRPSGEPDSKDLYLNYVKKTLDNGIVWIDHQLSGDKMAGGQPLARESKLLGSVYKTEQPGTFPLYEFISDDAGHDHAYSTDKTEYDGVDNYRLANDGKPMGYVYVQ